ncbi:DUF2332 domain-containing protein [Actinomadura mexicana]|uniref:DUF2332 domain-containing protein n=1 Tax=Actinomadura mexicana TaxID=134959 RepID=A0A238Y4P2_9ACTN|nr:DUF2332 domain-containing protein [Actinomadura mexicana]SNR65633.1 hypothetical protein SAMN06265355_105211 [Actinomadura mexicana]
MRRTGAEKAETKRALLAQARASAQLGSPMYAELLTRAADDPGRAVTGVLGERTGSGYILGMLGTVHRLVLAGRAPDLAAHYPTAGGTEDPLEAWPAFRDVLAEHADEIREGLLDPPQTNEVGRAAPLVGGLCTVADACRPARTAPESLPIRLLEIGASAGLNLRADRFRFLHESGAYGPESPVVLPDAWRGLPPVGAPLAITERRGCDPNPLDTTSPAGRQRLLSYVWPDQAARVARLRAAFEVAARVPATVVKAGAADFLEGLAPEQGVATVVWHSTMRAYMSQDEAASVDRSIERAGAAATPDAPVAHLSFEGRDASRLHVLHVVTLRLWPGGEPVILGEGPSHGLPTTWF